MIRRLTTILGYLLAATVIVLGTVLLIAYGEGYSYSFSSGRLVHKGLVILQSTPSGAHVTLDGHAVKEKTPYRKTLLGGKHHLTVSKDGYRTWSKDIDITASEVSLAQYIFLLPQHLPVDSLLTFSAVSATKASPDHKKIAVIANGSDAGLWVLDVNGKTRTKLYTPKTGTDDANPSETLTSVTWSQDNSRLLLQTAIGDHTNIYVLGTSISDQVVNVTDMFKADFTNLAFDSTNARQLYWNSDQGLRRLDLGNQSISAVLAEHVASFAPAGDRIVYVDASKPVRSLWLLDRSGHKTQIAAQIPEGQSYTLDFATFLGSAQVALTAQPAGTTVLYSNVLSDQIAAKPLASINMHAEFNGDGRYLLETGATTLSTYDIAKGVEYTFPLHENTPSNVSWFDNYHVLFDRAGQTVLAEFDGANAVALTKAGVVPAASTSDTKSVVAFSTTSTGTVQVKLIKIRQ